MKAGLVILNQGRLSGKLGHDNQKHTLTLKRHKYTPLLKSFLSQKQSAGTAIEKLFTRYFRASKEGDQSYINEFACFCVR